MALNRAVVEGSGADIVAQAAALLKPLEQAEVHLLKNEDVAMMMAVWAGAIMVLENALAHMKAQLPEGAGALGLEIQGRNLNDPSSPFRPIS